MKRLRHTLENSDLPRIAQCATAMMVGGMRTKVSEEVRCYGFSSLTGSDSVLQMDQWYLQPKTNPLVKNHKTWEVNLG